MIFAPLDVTVNMMILFCCVYDCHGQYVTNFANKEMLLKVDRVFSA